ncbi:amylo-alpha-1,6-glucosidase [Paenibacillus algorifonticola]|uniref:amylo-alpha-1,6-glucosidase n=1 Tax=Paenibacillus algorifonticola TaxID=684063 RepID=UPI003D2C05BF
MDYRVIKENQLFLITDKNGDISPESGNGLYTSDTRFLSRFEIDINGQKPVLLSSSADENYIAEIRLTNPHMEKDGQLILWRESVEIIRKRFIYEGSLYETFRITSYFPKPIRFDFSVWLDADFTDMFIVRGFQYGDIGSKIGDVTYPGKRIISYKGADHVTRETRINWHGSASTVDEAGKIHFDVELSHGMSTEITFTVMPVIDGQAPKRYEAEEAIQKLRDSYEEWDGSCTSISSDLPAFNRLFDRSVQDLRVLMTDVGHGPFPVAGLPLFAVPFGRDSLIAALQMLSLNPSIARGTLLTMAFYQGTKEDEWRDEQPGKIMHEIRYGELAGTNQVPFTPYYGTIDATPLFLLLAAEYFHWTADTKLIKQLLPNIDAALQWIDRYGDADGDGFVEYVQKSAKGIANQGWKDSSDSIVHADGEYALAPIALVEVQGYVYQAKKRLAPLFRHIGDSARADALEREALLLQERFEEHFWMEDEQFYAIALDGTKRQVHSVTSNVGHILMSGISSPERAEAVARRLVAADMFSGYGIRTMSTGAAGYNPMSYHDGSVWPHDNAMSVIGLSQSGFSNEAIAVMNGLLRASEQFEYARLPELFCGYEDSLGYPVQYPVACSPQAWAAGTSLTFVQAMLGIVPDALERKITLQPNFLPGMNELKVDRLYVGEGYLGLRIVTGQSGVPEVTVLANDTGYKLEIV